MRIGCYSLFTFNYVLTLLVNTQCQHLLVLPIFCSSAYYQANSVDKSTPSFGFHLALRNYHLLSPMCNEAGKVAQIACMGQFGQCLKEVFSFHKVLLYTVPFQNLKYFVHCHLPFPYLARAAHFLRGRSTQN